MRGGKTYQRLRELQGEEASSVTEGVTDTCFLGYILVSIQNNGFHSIFIDVDHFILLIFTSISSSCVSFPSSLSLPPLNNLLFSSDI